MSKQGLYCMAGTIVGFGIAQLFGGPLHQPIIGWFIGGTIMALTANYSFPPPKQRSHVVTVGLSLALGVVIMAVMNFMPKL